MARSQLAKVLKYLRPYWKPLLAGTIALLVVNVLTAYIPRMIGKAVDDLNQDFVRDHWLNMSGQFSSSPQSHWVFGSPRDYGYLGSVAALNPISNKKFLSICSI
jgi:ABC-type multidrug transport system fused ATPase/permease subunit